MKTEHLILGGAIVAGLIIFSKKDFATKVTYNVSEQIGEAAGRIVPGAVTGVIKGLYSTPQTEQINKDLNIENETSEIQRFLFEPFYYIKKPYSIIKGWGNKDKFWS